MKEDPSPEVLGLSRPAKYEVAVEQGVRIPSSVPGITLSADLYRPVGEDTVPVLVTLHSVRRDGLGGVAVRRYLRYFAERGYAAVFVQSAGIGASDGQPRPILSPGEVDDGVAVVDWAARQSWCTGKVGMWGESHGGMTTLAVAARRPASLKAIFPIMGLTDPERDLVHPGGLRGGIGMFGWLGVYNVLGGLLPLLRTVDQDEMGARWWARLDQFQPWFLDAWNNPPGADVWAERRVDVTKIGVPTFCVAGWRDLFCDAMIGAFEKIDAPKKLLVGPWMHMFPEAQQIEPVPSMALACDWWDQWLGQTQVDSDSGVSATVYVQGGKPKWVQTNWPLKTHTRLKLVATTAGRLRGSLPGPHKPRAAADERPLFPIIQTLDPTVGAQSGLCKIPVCNVGYPGDQHEDDSRSITFTSPPIDEPVTVGGRPRATLALGPRTTASRCVVKLTDVDEHDRSTLISMGLVDLTPPPFPHPSQTQHLGVALDPTCYTVECGHRLRLVLSDADFPRLWPADSTAMLEVVVAKLAVDGSECINEPDDAASPAEGATVLELPIVDPNIFPEATFVPVGRREKSKPRRKTSKPRWEIVRDHARGTLTASLNVKHAGIYIEQGNRLVERETAITSTINANDPSTAWMTASGSEVATTENGDDVRARVAIEMRHKSATINGSLRINGRVVYERTWRSPSNGNSTVDSPGHAGGVELP